MRCAVVLFGLLLPLPAFAQAPQGRYQGTAFDQKPDGTRGTQIARFS